jgi:ubiquinone/menaquinone biosynthesis C-methylase UbiE
MESNRTASILRGGGNSELSRLRLQAKIWRPAAEEFFAGLGSAPGSSAIDLACGAVGVLDTLSRYVGDAGTVVGLEDDPSRLVAASAYVNKTKLRNVSILEGIPFATGLPSAQFDLVHCRFLFALAGHDDAILAEMLRLVRPGGIIAIQEPDGSCWNVSAPSASWSSLKTAIVGAFRAAGGDFDAGLRTFRMLRAAGMQEVSQRNAVLACYGQHPYKRLPLQFARSLRPTILDSGLMSETRLRECMQDACVIASNPDSVMTTFIVTQVAARKL